MSGRETQDAARERLAETTAMLRIAGRCARLGGWTIHLATRELIWSDETCAIHDLPPGHRPTLDEGIGYFPAEYRATVRQHMTACEREGKPYDFELPKITASGRKIWVRSIGQAVRDDEGRIVGLQGAFQDITVRRHAEDALRASEARLVAAQAVANVGSWETDLVTLEGIWSAETHRIFETASTGFQPTHAGFLESVHPDDRERVNAAFVESLARCTPNAMEHRLLLADGRIKFIDERWHVVADEQGRPLRAIGTCQDITARRHTQDALLMQAHMLDQIGQAVIATDPDGLVTYANRFALELYGWGSGDLLGRHILNVTTPQVSQRQGEEIIASVQRGDSWTGEFLVQTRQGRVFPATVTNAPVLDERGQLVGIVGISTDITARKRAEDDARHKDAIIRIAGRLTHVGGWAYDVAGDRLFWSDELSDILGFPHGRTPAPSDAAALYPQPWRDVMVAALSACQGQGVPFDLETEILTATGQPKWVRVSGEPERDVRGAVTRIHGALQDITERRALEQQQWRAQRMESIGTLAAGIAHDLNNVLAPILLAVGLLEQDEQDAKRLEVLHTIESTAQRGAAMVGRLLAFARGADGQRHETQVALLLRELSTIVRDTFPKNITLVVRLDPDLWVLRADATQLHQVLLNLSVNARDAMDAGGQLVIAAKNIVLDEAFASRNIDARVGAYVMIAVEDTGSGIPKDVIDKIFDPFFTTKEFGKGTGLGLATSLAIVSHHEGFVRVHSDPQTGTRFEVYLPAQTTPAAPAIPRQEFGSLQGNGETVLVVDDEEAIREVARRVLEAAGYCVLSAHDGVEAINIYARRQAAIDVVLTDMMMPQMDGEATIQELFRLNPEVRIIAASGLATAVCPGAAGGRTIQFLSKPFTRQTLLAAVAAALLETRGQK